MPGPSARALRASGGCVHLCSIMDTEKPTAGPLEGLKLYKKANGGVKSCLREGLDQLLARSFIDAKVGGVKKKGTLSVHILKKNIALCHTIGIWICLYRQLTVWNPSNQDPARFAEPENPEQKHRSVPRLPVS